MATLRVPIDITESILYHRSGSRSQMQRIYDRFDNIPQMREPANEGKRCFTFTHHDVPRSAANCATVDELVQAGRQQCPLPTIDTFNERQGHDLPAPQSGKLGFDGVVPEATGRPSYHPPTLLTLYIYGVPQSGAVEPTGV
jgi:hypothetical protein